MSTSLHMRATYPRSQATRRRPSGAFLRGWATFSCAAFAYAFSIGGAASSASAEVRRVPGEYGTIQAAIDAAVDGDEVLVAAGLYVESVNIVGTAVVLRAESGPAVTTLEPDAETAIAVQAHVNAGTTRIDGFTVRGEFAKLMLDAADEARYEVVGNRFVDGGGWAVRITGGGVHDISGNTIENSTIERVDHHDIDVSVACEVTGNTFLGNGSHSRAMRVSSGFVPAQVMGNTIEDYGGAGSLVVLGGLGSVIISGNVIARCGSGIRNTTPGGFTITENLFIETHAPILISRGIATIRRNTIVDTPAGDGIMIIDSLTSTVRQNVVVGSEGAGIRLSNSPIPITCNLTFENAAGGIVGADLAFDNLDVDPRFCNPGAGDYMLAGDSPCLPENNPCELPMGALGQGCDAVPIVETTWSSIKSRWRP